MESKNIESSLKDALMGLQHYVDLQIRYNKILISKRMGEVSSYFVLFLLILGVFSFALLFLGFAFVEWYADAFGSRLQGRLIVVGFFTLLGVLLILLREPLLFSPIRKIFGKAFADDEKDDEDNPIYNSKEALNLQLKNYREIIDEEQIDLKEKLDDLGDLFTLSNIIQSAGKSIYNSFITTSNIAKLTYNLVQRYRGSSKKKHKTKEEPPLLQNDND